MSNIPTPGALELRGISKHFGGVRVLHSVDLTVAPGEVLALVGENGAGKSTLIKILTGLYSREEGSITLGGSELDISSPADAERAGIRVVHQDRHLAGRLTVAEQLYLGATDVPLISGRGLIRRAEADLSRLVGLDLPADLLIDDLTVAEQQLVQIAAAILVTPRVLILDEPTAPLAAAEVERLFATLQRLRDAGVAIIYISHYLREVREVSDRVLVLRNGERVGDVDLRVSPPPAGTTDPVLDHIVELMVGRSVNEFGARTRPAPDQTGTPALEVSRLGVPGSLENFAVSVYPGEVVGVTGLVGSGIERLADAVTGAEARAGSVALSGKPVRNSRAFVAAGGAYVPSDRRRDGVLLGHTVRENLSLASLGAVTGALGLIRAAAERTLARDLVTRLGIRPARPEAVAGTLSGGNQQKVVLGRWLAARSRLFVLDQPTAGVDIGSREQIYERIDEAVDAGSGVLLISLDLEELIGLSDRVLILYRGEIVAELPRAEATVDAVLALASGSREGTLR